MANSFPAAAWHADPSGRFAQRYWNGSAWTEHVIDAAGQRAIDPPATVPAAVDKAGEVLALLETRMVDYGNLLDATGPDTDEVDFARQALKIGLLVRDTDAWLLDVPSGRWFRYDGVALTPLGGWSSRPSGSAPSATGGVSDGSQG